VEYPFYSDHAPVLLKFNSPLQPFACPFKFNHHWLESAEYSELVHLIWTDPCFLLEGNPQLRLHWKLKELKARSKSWSILKKKSEEALLNNLDSEIKKLLHLSSAAALSSEIQLP
jgi:hypothetical protein